MYGGELVYSMHAEEICIVSCTILVSTLNLQNFGLQTSNLELILEALKRHFRSTVVFVALKIS